MSKYIDADKFIKKFEKMIDDIPASVDSGAGYVIDEVYKIFDSLQQEQPEVDLEKEFSLEYATYHFPDFILETLCDRMGVIDFIYTTARHFWNKGYNARNKK